MEAEAALGHREAVAERYELLRGELDQRLGLEPSSQTKHLYRTLLSQDRTIDRPAEVAQASRMRTIQG